MTKSAYIGLINENIKWIEQFPDTLERKHIIGILLDSIKQYYPHEDECYCENCKLIGLLRG